MPASQAGRRRFESGRPLSGSFAPVALPCCRGSSCPVHPPPRNDPSKDKTRWDLRCREPIGHPSEVLLHTVFDDLGEPPHYLNAISRTLAAWATPRERNVRRRGRPKVSDSLSAR